MANMWGRQQCLIILFMPCCGKVNRPPAGSIPYGHCFSSWLLHLHFSTSLQLGTAAKDGGPRTSVIFTGDSEVPGFK